MDNNDKLLKPYDHQATETRIYNSWDKNGFFNPDNLSDNKKGSFTIIMPPPNANGNLHAGHALFITLEDIMIRYKRMSGYKALWIPGADHAGFETQIVYEKKLEKEGKSRFRMDPQDLYKEIYDFTIINKKNMYDQIRSMGASCDWSRERFTLDPEVVKEVQKTFKKMYDDGLIYRGARIVNWCSKHQTSLSDVETTTKEKKDPFYYFKYGPFVIGTARPETKFGDKYVVMHPDDSRYKEYSDGQKINLEWINGPITATIIKDEAIDMDFGTGVMTITPWHDATDFAIALRHNLDREQIIDIRGKLLPIAGEFAGMKINDARPKIVEKLKAKGLLVKIDEEYIHNVPVCYKCETTIEPQILPQWFVRMKPLAELALKAIEENKITFYPDNYKKIFTYWMENTIDWNISRQIIWGIPIPAKICTKCGDGFPDLDNKHFTCPKCGGEAIQDPDTFDTWFSSGQWPLITLGFPDDPDFKEFYPTDVMESGYDLIFRWIPRMVIFGLYLAKDIPFKDVYLHGLVNDAQGKKMSKSKGNVVNPLDLTSKYGTDALRMALIVGNPAGSDTSLSESKVKGYRNFSNKIWNATRFVLTNIKGLDMKTKLTEKDKKYVEEFSHIASDITSDLDAYRFHLASEKIYHYFWHTFADVIIEESKKSLSDDKEKASTKKMLIEILTGCIKILHPFMPFITEEIWSFLPTKDGRMLIIERWPY